MGRVINPDHFYVGTGTAGSGVSKTGRFDSDHGLLARWQAKLKRQAPHRDRPQPRAPASKGNISRAPTATSAVASVTPTAVPERLPTEARSVPIHRQPERPMANRMLVRWLVVGLATAMTFLRLARRRSR